MTSVTLGMQLVVLVSTIGLCLEIYRINVELSAISGRLAVTSAMIEKQ